ncbi:MAG: hypothetical protein NT080_01205 [Spirochaetes bacterium]|nr:hypothetical protein [Spirochaetota bacterium]
MKTPAFWRAIGILLLYIGIFGLIVVIQFPVHGDLRAVYGSLSLRGGVESVGGSLGSVVADLSGLRFEFSARRPLQAVAANGERRPGVPVARTDIPFGWRIAFDNGVSLSFSSSDETGARLSVEPSFKDQAVSVELAYALVRGTRMERGKGGIRLVTREGGYAIELPSDAIDEKRRTITLDAAGGRTRPFVVRLEREGAPAISPQVMAQAPMDPAAYRRAIDAFVAKTWTGLSTARFDEGAFAWKSPGGNAVFSEKALTAYVAEAFRRGAGPAALERMKPAKTKYVASLSYLSSPYLGGILPRTKAMEEAALAEVKRFEKAIQDKSPELFDRTSIALFLLDRAPYSLAQGAFQAIQSIDPAQLTVRQAVNALAASNDARDFMKAGENPFSRFEAAAERNLLPAIKRYNNGFFLQASSDGDCDLLLSVVAGRELIRFGTASGREVFVGVGQSLVTGVLALADANGFVPGNQDLTGKVPVSAYLPPEDLYPLVADNPYYPHEVPFYRELGPGVWAWTCSPSIQVSTEQSKIVFRTEFPPLAAHHLVLYGLKPFVNIQLYGINYRPDESFEIYDASGYFFNRASNSMFLKMRHKAKIEEIRLFY